MGPEHPGRSILDALYNKEGDLNRAAFFVFVQHEHTLKGASP